MTAIGDRRISSSSLLAMRNAKCEMRNPTELRIELRTIEDSVNLKLLVDILLLLVLIRRTVDLLSSCHGVR